MSLRGDGGDVTQPGAMDQKPNLRDDLYVDQDLAEGVVVLRDPIADNVHHLNPLAAAIARRLNGHRRLSDIKAEVESLFKIELSDEEILDYVGELDRRLMLESGKTRLYLAGLARRVKAEQKARFGLTQPSAGPFEVPVEQVEVRQDLRYECRMCGACCSGRFRVELEKKDEERLRALDLKGQFGVHADDVMESDYVAGDSPESEPRRFLRFVEGRCIFLDKNQRCALHRVFGREAKPLGCRLFPFNPLLTPRGALLQYRPECSRQYATWWEGPLAMEQKAATWREAAAGFEVMARLPEVFPLVGETSIEYDDYLDLEGRWLEAAGHGGWRALLAAMRADLVEAADDPDESLPRDRLRRVLLTLVARCHGESIETSKGPALGQPSLRATAERSRQVFARLLPGDASTDLFMLHVLLLQLEVVSPLGPKDYSELFRRSHQVRQVERVMESDVVDPLLTEYAVNLVAGKYLFQGLSIASGAGLLVLVLLGARFSAAYASVVADGPVDAERMNEALIAWHLMLFNRPALRARLLVARGDELERLIECDLEVISPDTSG